MRLLPFAPETIRSVLEDLRPADRRELAATLWDFDPAGLAEASARAPLGFVAGDEAGRAVAVVGATPLWPGVWQVGLFATPRWPAVARAVQLRVRRRLVPDLLRAGAHRAQAFSDARHHEAHRWLRRLGARCEGRLAAFGRAGEDFLLFAWTRDAFASERRDRPRPWPPPRPP